MLKRVGILLVACIVTGCTDTMGPEPETAEAVGSPILSSATDPCVDEELCKMDPIYVDGCSDGGCWCDEFWCYPYDDPADDGSGGDNPVGGGGGGSGGSCIYCSDDDSVDISEAPDSIDADWYNTLTQAEKELCVSSYLLESAAGVPPANRSCAQYYVISANAIAWSEQQTDSNGVSLQGCHNGPCDAAKHAFWSGTLAQVWGSTKAEIWTNAHEKGVGYHLEETPMDLRNNSVGRQLAGESGVLGTLVMLRLSGSDQDSLQSGDLKWLSVDKWE